ncbi:hypothetical protein D3C71_1771000 [compost metagenome]
MQQDAVADQRAEHHGVPPCGLAVGAALAGRRHQHGRGGAGAPAGAGMARMGSLPASGRQPGIARCPAVKGQAAIEKCRQGIQYNGHLRSLP